MIHVASARAESVGAAIARRMVVQQAEASAESDLVIARLVARSDRLAEVPWPDRSEMSRQLGAQQIEVADALREVSASLEAPAGARMNLVADQTEVKARRFIENLPAAEVNHPRREGER